MSYFHERSHAAVMPTLQRLRTLISPARPAGNLHHPCGLLLYLSTLSRSEQNLWNGRFTRLGTGDIDLHQPGVKQEEALTSRTRG
ncbi:hypothetical protein NKDENANG_00595 [Candidatus Entotheonellaceae bacterium PAL068K]